MANSTENMIDILLDVFLNLDPGLEFCLQAGLKQQSDQLAYLVLVKEAFNDLLTYLDTVMFLTNSGMYLCCFFYPFLKPLYN